MKILYFDCSNGISGDMLLKAAADLSGRSDEIYEKINEAAEHGICGGSHHGYGDCCGGHGSHGADGHDHHDHGHHGHGRSYDEVKSIIAGSRFPEAAKAAAAAVYANIARAEAKVHGATLETVHFPVIENEYVSLLESICIISVPQYHTSVKDIHHLHIIMEMNRIFCYVRRDHIDRQLILVNDFFF